MTIVYFVILIGVLIFVHEGGHFLMAKLFKVKVHTFSLGFGPKLIGFRKGETLYKISVAPIGGYVKMLGEDPTEEILPEDRGRAFSDKPYWQRFLIMVGGPAMNLIFPLILHFFVGLSFTQVDPASVGMVLSGSPAEKAGLQAGDEIIQVEGRDVETFDEVVAAVSPNPGKQLLFKVKRGDEILEMPITPRPTPRTVVLNVKDTIGQIGVSTAYVASVIGVSDPASPAMKGGLQAFDRIVAVDGKKIERFMDLEEAITAAAGKSVELSYFRMKPDLKPTTEDLYEADENKMSFDVPAGTGSLEDLGIFNSMDFVVYVDPDGEAAKIGLKRGDRLLSLDGEKQRMGQIYTAIDRAPAEDHLLAWTSGGVEKSATFRPKFIPAGEGKDLGLKNDAYDKGFWGYSRGSPQDKIDNPSLISSACIYSGEQTWQGLRLMGIGFKLLFSGEVSMKSIGGPIMIGQLAGMAGEQGASTFFWMMALISLNLGLLNLLPIPVLDGGQIMFQGIEAVTRRKVSRAIKERVMLVGLVMIVALMIFATWNDIQRLIFEYFSGSNG